MARIFVDLVGDFRDRFGEVWQSFRRGGVIDEHGCAAGNFVGHHYWHLERYRWPSTCAGSFRRRLIAPFQMAAYLNENVPVDEVIETYEPEMGFLTDHRFHFPPHSYLNQTIQSIWMGGASPGEDYNLSLRRSRDIF